MFYTSPAHESCPRQVHSLSQLQEPGNQENIPWSPDYCGNKSALSPVYAYSVLSTEAFGLLAGVLSAAGVIRF